MTETTPPLPPPEPRWGKPIGAGFLCGGLAWVGPWIASGSTGGPDAVIVLLIFAGLILPLVSLVAALIPRTRPFGLGMLLATGLGLVVLGAICGGVIR